MVLEHAAPGSDMVCSFVLASGQMTVTVTVDEPRQVRARPGQLRLAGPLHPGHLGRLHRRGAALLRLDHDGVLRHGGRPLTWIPTPLGTARLPATPRRSRHTRAARSLQANRRDPPTQRRALRRAPRRRLLRGGPQPRARLPGPPPPAPGRALRPPVPQPRRALRGPRPGRHDRPDQVGRPLRHRPRRGVLDLRDADDHRRDQALLPRQGLGDPGAPAAAGAAHADRFRDRRAHPEPGSLPHAARARARRSAARSRRSSRGSSPATPTRRCPSTPPTTPTTARRACSR